MAPKPNAFMEFCKEWKSKYGKEMTFPQAITESGKVWKEMNASERAPYIERVKNMRIHKPTNGPANDKYTCTGRRIKDVELEKAEVEYAERQMKRNIEMTVRNSMKERNLLTKKYYFIMVNYFTKSLSGGYYVPAEIAVSEFSLKYGVMRKYHSFINPGGELFGRHYDAVVHSNETHKLPLPPNALGSKNLSKIYGDILEFIYDEESGTYPTLYTLRRSMPIVESVLNFLRADPDSCIVELRIYSLEYLLFIYKDAACEISDEEKIESYHIIETHVENDFFEYQAGIACDYHEEKDATKHCALSYVTRWGFLFCDLLCKNLAVDLTPGKHCPHNVNLSKVYDRNSSCSTKLNDEVYANASSKLPRKDSNLKQSVKREHSRSKHTTVCSNTNAKKSAHTIPSNLKKESGETIEVDNKRKLQQNISAEAARVPEDSCFDFKFNSSKPQTSSNIFYNNFKNTYIEDCPKIGFGRGRRMK